MTLIRAVYTRENKPWLILAAALLSFLFFCEGPEGVKWEIQWTEIDSFAAFVYNIYSSI